jgi:hypothetical protein
MVKKRGKASFDAMVKFFMQSYNIPTKKDIDKLIARLDQMEKFILSTLTSPKTRRPSGGPDTKTKAAPALSASDKVLEIIRRNEKGIGFAEIEAQSGFGGKKLRNIIFRLNKMGKITRVSRGIYIAT